MKVYELIQELAKHEADKEVLVHKIFNSGFKDSIKIQPYPAYKHRDGSYSLIERNFNQEPEDVIVLG